MAAFFISWAKKTGRKAAGQSVLEYAVLLGVVSTAFIAMSMYVRQAIQGKLKKIDERVMARPQEFISGPASVGGPLI
jgi:Flp pilus assembly pilin Flp